MKKLIQVILVALAVTSVAMAQGPLQGVDELGAHNGYGRGCVMCHAPHGGALGNGTQNTVSGVSPFTATAYSDTNNGVIALWGQALTPYYGLSTAFSGDNKQKYPITLPTTPLAGIGDAGTVILMCLSCHDGNLARVSMMKGQTYEPLPIVGGNAPTLFGLTQGNSPTYYKNEHPVGPYAVVACGGGHNWDCSGGDTTAKGTGVTSIVTPGPAIQMTGTASAAFVANYPGSFWNNWSSSNSNTYSTYAQCATSYDTGGACTPSNPLSSFTVAGTGGFTTVNGVACTTCHNQHSMTAYSNSMGNWATMFFIKGYYNPTTGGNSVAQFCRNCHGGNSNEMVGVSGVPTT